MQNDAFEAVVSQGDEGPLIRLVGTVNRNAKEQLEDAYSTASAKSGEIVLDFTEVDYINSTGIAVIVGVLGAARAVGRQVGALGLSPHYREVFEITRLSEFMNIYNDATTG